MIWGIVSLVLLLIVIGLTIWLLVRANYTCPTGAKLNESCATSSDCNSGLVCQTVSGINGVTGSAGLGRVCKVASGGICSLSSECGSGQSCVNGLCAVTLGGQGQLCPCGTGFTCINGVCRAVLGQPCTAGTDCETGLCSNNICVATMGPTGCYNDSCYTDCDTRYTDTCDTRYTDTRYTDSRDTRYTDTRDSGTRDSGTRDSGKSYTRDSGKSYSKSYSYDSGKSYTKSYSYDSGKSYSSDTDTRHNSYDKHSWSDCSDSCERGYRKHGVYVTNQQNNDRTLFSGIPEAIVDIAQQGTANFYLLLANGDIVSSVGITNTTLHTNKKMFRMVRFGTDYVGIDRRGQVYSRTAVTATSWTWSGLKKFPRDVIFIDSTNDYQHLEVLTNSGKAYVYRFAADWCQGVPIETRRQHDYRYYGQNLTRWIDIDQRNNTGKTNDGVRYRHIKAAGFYSPLLGATNGGEIVQVLKDDKFTHVRVIANNAYFLFQQC